MNQNNNDIADVPAMPPQVVLFQMITGYMVSQAIYVAAKLSIADLLAEKPKNIEELAIATQTDAKSLYRVMRALASVNIFTEDVEGVFSLTPMADCLRTDALGSMKAFSVYMGESWHQRAWGEILYSVKTGKISFEHVFNLEPFPYFAANAEAANIFDQAMTSFTSSVAPILASSYDFSSAKKIVDIGGGHGILLVEILKLYTNSSGILFDLPSVIEGANLIKDNNLSERCELVAGNFFESIPKGGDIYIMKHVIHDWDDERSLKILRNCHQSMNENGKVLLFEAVVPEKNIPSFSKILDLEMLLIAGGKERTQKEYCELLENAGFKLINIIQTPSVMNIVEAVRI